MDQDYDRAEDASRYAAEDDDAWEPVELHDLDIGEIHMASVTRIVRFGAPSGVTLDPSGV